MNLASSLAILALALRATINANIAMKIAKYDKDVATRILPKLSGHRLQTESAGTPSRRLRPSSADSAVPFNAHPTKIKT